MLHMLNMKDNRVNLIPNIMHTGNLLSTYSFMYNAFNRMKQYGLVWSPSCLFGLKLTISQLIMHFF